jgi:alkylation response protein AidB-like acyl-CoA dehydrogenase
MHFAFTEQQDALRREVQDFIATHLTAELRAAIEQGELGLRFGPEVEAFLELVIARGWTGVSWPVEFGGQGRSAMEQFIIEEEFHRVGLRIGGAGTGAPAILASGTAAQKQAFVPGCIRGDIIFAQGYSEPGCGTDLAGIQCRATRQGETYVIRGQKIYTTSAHVATHIFLMVRTDPQSRRQAGLSILLVPMDTPGITVRPLWTIQADPLPPPGTTYGEPRTNEVFFDDVVVPVDCRLGAEHDGWAVAQRGLNLDRVGARRYLISVLRDEDIVNWLKQDGAAQRDLREDPVVRDKLAELWIEGQVCRLLTMRSMSIEARGGHFVYEGAAEKVWAPEHGVRATEAIGQILGPQAQLLNGSALAVERGIFAHNLLSAFQSTINHGSVQVMRDQIARRGLGLPRPTRG